MPRYDYVCPVCGYTEERSHSSEKKDRFRCPKCQQEGERVWMEWQFPAPAIDNKSDHPRVPRPPEILKVKTKEQEAAYEEQIQKGGTRDGVS